MWRGRLDFKLAIIFCYCAFIFSWVYSFSQGSVLLLRAGDQLTEQQYLQCSWTYPSPRLCQVLVVTRGPETPFNPSSHLHKLPETFNKKQPKKAKKILALKTCQTINNHGWCPCHRIWHLLHNHSDITENHSPPWSEKQIIFYFDLMSPAVLKILQSQRHQLPLLYFELLSHFRIF